MDVFLPFTGPNNKQKSSGNTENGILVFRNHFMHRGYFGLNSLSWWDGIARWSEEKRLQEPIHWKSWLLNAVGVILFKCIAWWTALSGCVRAGDHLDGSRRRSLGPEMTLKMNYITLEATDYTESRIGPIWITRFLSVKRPTNDPLCVVKWLYNHGEWLRSFGGPHLCSFWCRDILNIRTLKLNILNFTRFFFLAGEVILLVHFFFFKKLLSDCR